MDDILEKIEDKFLEHKLVKGKWPENLYYNTNRSFRWVDEKLYRPFKNFFHNLVKYRDFLSKDYWWDNHFLFSMLKIKLEKDAENYRKYGITTSANEYAEQMEHCVEILDRIIEDEYSERALKPHYEKWGERSLSFGWVNGVSKEESEDFTEHILAADEKMEKDIKDVFSYISSHVRTWWD
jgi:hypothetical protein